MIKFIKNLFKRKEKSLIDPLYFSFTCLIKINGEWVGLLVSNNGLSFDVFATDEKDNTEFGDVRLYNKIISREEFLKMCSLGGIPWGISLKDIKNSIEFIKGSETDEDC